MQRLVVVLVPQTRLWKGPKDLFILFHLGSFPFKKIYKKALWCGLRKKKVGHTRGANKGLEEVVVP